MMAMMTILISRARACADRIGDVLATAPTITTPPRPVVGGDAWLLDSGGARLRAGTGAVATHSLNLERQRRARDQ
jgi:hypothetical protein